MDIPVIDIGPEDYQSELERAMSEAVLAMVPYPDDAFDVPLED